MNTILYVALLLSAAPERVVSVQALAQFDTKPACQQFIAARKPDRARGQLAYACVSTDDLRRMLRVFGLNPETIP